MSYIYTKIFTTACQNSGNWKGIYNENYILFHKTTKAEIKSDYGPFHGLYTSVFYLVVHNFAQKNIIKRFSPLKFKI